MKKVVSRIADMRNKEVVNVKDGTKLGFIDDVEFDTVTAELTALVIFGKARFFGLFGREEDIVITWQDIEVIGEDTVLVSFDAIQRLPIRKAGFFSKLFD
ncbi:MAG: YlmC/YmxH family sporulation protein [Oscillospiraceae bacterium]|nr:YlmC/YmxH family sporulation protein [Oscillospiraceae bacterium]